MSRIEYIRTRNHRLYKGGEDPTGGGTGGGPPGDGGAYDYDEVITVANPDAAPGATVPLQFGTDISLGDVPEWNNLDGDGRRFYLAPSAGLYTFSLRFRPIFLGTSPTVVSAGETVVVRYSVNGGGASTLLTWVSPTTSTPGGVNATNTVVSGSFSVTLAAGDTVRFEAQNNAAQASAAFGYELDADATRLAVNAPN